MLTVNCRKYCLYHGVNCIDFPLKHGDIIYASSRSYQLDYMRARFDPATNSFRVLNERFEYLGSVKASTMNYEVFMSCVAIYKAYAIQKYTDSFVEGYIFGVVVDGYPYGFNHHFITSYGAQRTDVIRTLPSDFIFSSPVYINSTTFGIELSGIKRYKIMFTPNDCN